MKNYTLLLGLLALSIIISQSDHCQKLNSPDKVFIIEKQTQVYSLSDYIDGYNIKFSVNDTQTDRVKIQQIFTEVDTQDIGFEAGSRLLGVDMLKWTGKVTNTYPGILFAIDSQGKWVIAEVDFSGGADLPVINRVQDPFTPPEEITVVNCVILNTKYSVLFDWQRPDKDQEGLYANYLCLQKQDSTGFCSQQITSQKKAISRITKLYQTQENGFYIQYAFSFDVDSSDLDSSFLVFTIKETQIHSQKITKQFLKLDALSPVHMVFDSKNYILLVSMNSERNFDLVSFRVLKGKLRAITNLEHSIEGKVSAVQICGDRIFFALEDKVVEASYPQITVLKNYETPQSDPIITEIQVNQEYLIFRSSTDKQYIYRKESTRNQLIMHESSVEDSFILLQPFSNFLLIVKVDKLVLNKISSGFLTVKGGEEDLSVSVIGISGHKICDVNFEMVFVKDSNSVYEKKPINNKHFTFTPDEKVKFVLDEYFGGPMISYEASSSSAKDISLSLLEIQSYTINNPPADMDLYQVIGIDNKNFYLAGVKSPNFIVKICSVLEDDATINCQNYWNYDQLNKTVVGIHGIRGYDNQLSVVFCYDGHSFSSIDLKNPKFSITFTLDSFHYTQVLVGQKYTFFILKENLISIRFFPFSIVTYGKNSFSTRELNEMKGFYPREIRANPSNPQTFFVKLTNGIAAIAINQEVKTLQFLKYINIFNSYISDDLWTFVAGKETILIIAPDFVHEYHRELQTLLHKINVKLVLPVSYDEVTDTVFARNTQGKLVILRMNRGATDSILWTGDSASQNSLSVSWGWVAIPESNLAYLVPKRDQLAISAHLSDDQFKKSYDLTLKVSSPGNQPFVSETVLSYINYPTKIKELTNEDTIITLPTNANNESAEIQVPMASYFSGWANTYSIDCSFAIHNKINLILPVRWVADQSYNFKAPARDVLTGDDFAVILDGEHNIFLVDSDNTMLATVSIDATDFHCEKMGILSTNLSKEGNSLFILCTSRTSKTQKIYRYTINKEEISYASIYDLEEADFIKTPQEIIPVVGANQDYWIFVLDVDTSVDTNEKTGDVKIFPIIDGMMDKGQTITSTDFGVTAGAPINGMDVYDAKNWFVVIGGEGIGGITTQDQQRVFRFWDLKNNQKIQQYSLNGNLYQSIKVLSIDSNENSQVFITSTNSLHLVLELSVPSSENDENVKILESYNRMSDFHTINWAVINKEKVVLAYIDLKNNQVSLGFYNRSLESLTNSHISLNIPYSSSQKSTRFAGVTKDRIFLYKQDGNLSSYRYLEPFSLVGNYTAPGSFQRIEFTAKNSVSQTSHWARVKFDFVEYNGIRWYWILLGVALALIVIGLSLGYYVRIRGRRSNKKTVSLITEHDDEDEEV